MKENLQKKENLFETEKTASIDFNVLDTLLRVGDIIKKSKLDNKLKKAQEEIALLMHYLGTTRDETVLFTAILITAFDCESQGKGLQNYLNNIATFFDCSSVHLLQYYDVFMSLTEKKLINENCVLTLKTFASNNFSVNGSVSNCIIKNRANCKTQ